MEGMGRGNASVDFHLSFARRFNGTVKTCNHAQLAIACTACSLCSIDIINHRMQMNCGWAQCRHPHLSMIRLQQNQQQMTGSCISLWQNSPWWRTHFPLRWYKTGPRLCTVCTRRTAKMQTNKQTEKNDNKVRTKPKWVLLSIVSTNCFARECRPRADIYECVNVDTDVCARTEHRQKFQTDWVRCSLIFSWFSLMLVVAAKLFMLHSEMIGWNGNSPDSIE